MAWNISELITPWTVFIFVLIVVLVAIIFLTRFEKNLGRRIFMKRERETYYSRRLREIKQLEGKPSEFLAKLDELAREFLEEKFGVDKSEKYADLISHFEKGGNRAAVEFSRRMQEAFYAGEDLDKEKLDFLFRNFDFLVNTERKIRMKALKEKEVEARREESKKNLSDKAVEEVKKIFGGRNEVNQSVVRYLAEGKRRGFSLNLLKQKLRESKYSEDEIDDAIEYLNLHVEGVLPVKTNVEAKPRFTDWKPLTSKDIKIPKRKANKREPKSHKRISSLDDFSRLKERIKGRQSGVGSEVFDAKTGLV